MNLSLTRLAAALLILAAGTAVGWVASSRSFASDCSKYGMTLGGGQLIACATVVIVPAETVPTRAVPET